MTLVFILLELWHSVILILATRLNGVLKFATIVHLSLLSFLLTENGESIHGLVYANLAFIAALIFHAGISINRIKTLESKVDILEKERIAVELAGIKTNLLYISRSITKIEDWIDAKEERESDLRLRAQLEKD